MFCVDPFEWPAVPVAGAYAVVYLDGAARLLGGPRFTVEIDQSDPSLRYSDGDRWAQPQLR
jgi:hypothetical protein